MSGETWASVGITIGLGLFAIVVTYVLYRKASNQTDILGALTKTIAGQITELKKTAEDNERSLIENTTTLIAQLCSWDNYYRSTDARERSAQESNELIEMVNQTLRASSPTEQGLTLEQEAKLRNAFESDVDHSMAEQEERDAASIADAIATILAGRRELRADDFVAAARNVTGIPVRRIIEALPLLRKRSILRWKGELTAGTSLQSVSPI